MRGLACLLAVALTLPPLYARAGDEPGIPELSAWAADQQQEPPAETKAALERFLADPERGLSDELPRVEEAIEVLSEEELESFASFCAKNPHRKACNAAARRIEQLRNAQAKRKPREPKQTLQASKQGLESTDSKLRLAITVGLDDAYDGSLRNALSAAPAAPVLAAQPADARPRRGYDSPSGRAGRRPASAWTPVEPLLPTVHPLHIPAPAEKKPYLGRPQPVHRLVTLDPKPLAAPGSSARIAWSKIPDLPSQKAKAYARLLQQLPAIEPGLAAALGKGGAERFFLRDGQLNLVINDPAGNQEGPVALVADTFNDGKFERLRAFLITGRSRRMIDFSADGAPLEMRRFDPKLSAKSGRKEYALERRFENGQAIEVAGPTEEKPGFLATVGGMAAGAGGTALNAIGTTAGVVFSPFQSAALGLQSAGMKLVAEGYSAADPGSFKTAWWNFQQSYTNRQAAFMNAFQWLRGVSLGSEPGIRNAYDATMGLLEPRAQDEMRTFLDHKIRLEQEQDPEYILLRNQDIDEPLRARKAAAMFGGLNLPAQDFEIGQEYLQRSGGEKGSGTDLAKGLGYYSLGMVDAFGRMFLESAGVGMVTTPAKLSALRASGKISAAEANAFDKVRRAAVAGAKGIQLTAEEAAAVQKVAGVMKTFNLAELGVMATPTLTNIISDGAKLFAGAMSGNSRESWEAINGLAGHVPALAGIISGLRQAAKTPPPAALPARPAGEKEPRVPGPFERLPPTATLEDIDATYQRSLAELQARLPADPAKDNAAYQEVSLRIAALRKAYEEASNSVSAARRQFGLPETGELTGQDVRRAYYGFTKLHHPDPALGAREVAAQRGGARDEGVAPAPQVRLEAAHGAYQLLMRTLAGKTEPAAARSASPAGREAAPQPRQLPAGTESSAPAGAEAAGREPASPTQKPFALPRAEFVDGKLVFLNPDGTPTTRPGPTVLVPNPEGAWVQISTKRLIREYRKTGHIGKRPRALGRMDGDGMLVVRGDEVAEDVVDFIRGQAGKPLRLSFYELHNPEILAAILDRSARDPVTLVINESKMSTEAQTRIRDAQQRGQAITLRPPPYSFNHNKLVVAKDGGRFTTGGLGPKDKAAQKVEISIPIPKSVAETLERHQRLVNDPSSRGARRKLAAELDGQGFLVNDPDAGAMRVSREIYRMLDAKTSSLRIYVDEIKDAAAVDKLLARARAPGTTVEIYLRRATDVTPALRDKIRAAAKDGRHNLILRTFPQNIDGLLHGSVIINDEGAYVGTAFLWSPQLNRFMPTGRSMESGVRLSKGGAAALLEKLNASLPEAIVWDP